MTDAAPGAPAMPIRVLLVDDDALVRAGLTMMLAGSDDVVVVGEASDGAEVLKAVDSARPDVVLMDIRMPTVDGLTATEALLRRPSPPHVIVLTTFDADAHVLRALRAGAAGFLVKDTPPGTIVDAILAVHRGNPILSPSVTRRLIEYVTVANGSGAADRESARRRLAMLTPREREVAGAIARGLSNADIAAEMHFSVATVKAHVSRLFTRLDVENRVQIAILVHEAGPDSP